jgi:hypothetical protein
MCAIFETNETFLPATSISTVPGVIRETDLLQQGRHILILPSLPARLIVVVESVVDAVVEISTVIHEVEAGSFIMMTVIATTHAIVYQIARIAHEAAHGNRYGETGIREMSVISREGIAKREDLCQGSMILI